MIDKEISTGGGAAVGSDVDTDGGNFIGRDSVFRQNIYAGLTTREMFRLRIVGAYERLWALMEPFALYSRPQPVTYEIIRTLSATMRHWYFQKAGGLYMLQLSQAAPTRAAYLALQDTLRDVIASGDMPPETELDEATFELIRSSTSKLRHAIAEELNLFLIQGATL